MFVYLVFSELAKFVAYLELFYSDSPCDWLLSNYIKTKACGIDFNTDDCSKKLMNKYSRGYRPRLFIHKGKFSSQHGIQRKIGI